MNDLEQRLAENDIKPTAVRTLILRAMDEYIGAFSLTDLEAQLGTVDRSTISRTLHTFVEHRLIHSIVDGSGSVKYSLCRRGCRDRDCHVHPHFTCTRCGRTLCLDRIAMPHVSLPEGFEEEDVSLLVRGRCNNCR